MNIRLYFYACLGSLFVFLSYTSCSPSKSTAEQPASNTEASVTGAPAEEAMAEAAAHYQEFCSSCHGRKAEAFVDRRWQYGSSSDALFKGIKYGYEQDGMPAYDTAFTDQEIYNLVAYLENAIQNVGQYTAEEEELPEGTIQTEEISFRLDTVVSGLDIPWGMTFLPNGDMLITERDGRLYRRSGTGQLQRISGVPEVLARGQGGLLDIELHPNYEQNGWLYLSYSKPRREGGQTTSTTAVMRARLDGNALSEQEVIFEALPYSNTRHHYGSRLEFDRQGYLYISVGDRGNRSRNPQNLDNHCGKMHRIYDDGRIPEDNPFVDQPGAMPSIYSYGHRNPQGVSRHPATGMIWTHEHGPRGGDEVNIIEKGKNYGWPVISYGINYNGTTFTDKTEQEGMEQPEWYWVPSIAPCGSAFVTGDRYPAWKGDFMVGSLRFQYLNRCVVEDGKIVREERLLKDIGRVRAVEMGPDGYLYLSVEDPGFIFRLLPNNN